MECRPYVLLGESTVVTVRDALQAQLDAWARDWGVARQSVELICHRGWEPGGPEAAAWQDCRASGEQVLWFAWPKDLAGQVQQTMFPPDRSYAMPAGASEMASGAALKALLDLRNALASIVHVAADDVDPAGALRQASGAIRAELRFGRVCLHCLLNDGAVRAIAALGQLRKPAQREGLAPLAPVSFRDTLAEVPLVLDIAIGQAQVNLGTLRTLGAGDVIRLQAPADEPLAVRNREGKPMFAGYLGKNEQHLALEVVRLEQTSGVN